jgi:hypothetical protein
MSFKSWRMLFGRAGRASSSAVLKINYEPV